MTVGDIDTMWQSGANIAAMGPRAQAFYRFGPVGAKGRRRPLSGAMAGGLGLIPPSNFAPSVRRARIRGGFGGRRRRTGISNPLAAIAMRQAWVLAKGQGRRKPIKSDYLAAWEYAFASTGTPRAGKARTSWRKKLARRGALLPDYYGPGF